MGRRFSHDGTLLSEQPFQTGEVMLAESGGRYPRVSAEMLEDGRIFLAWQYGSGVSSNPNLNPGLYTQVVEYDLQTDLSTAVSDPVRTTFATETRYFAEHDPDITVLESGDVVAAAAHRTVGSSTAFHRLFAPDGTPRDDATVQPGTGTDYMWPGVAALGNGGYVVGWSDRPDPDDSTFDRFDDIHPNRANVFLQQYDASGLAVGEMVSPTVHLDLIKSSPSMTRRRARPGAC